MEKIHKLWITILLVMAIALGGCSNTTETISGEVELSITKNFGNEGILNESIILDKKMSVMELLNQYLQVETEYGGGFVNSINGLTSGYTNTSEKEKLDWFYFINGIMTDVGATQYFPTDGDKIWWDYHLWGNIPFTPAVIGSFPQPFLNGYQGKNSGTLILVGKGCEELATSLRDYLHEVGVENVEVQDYEEELVADRSKITLVVALWEELFQSGFWAGIQKNRDKTGWFAELQQEAFYSLNEEAERQKTYDEGVGAILATAMGMGDPTPLWLVTGLDKKGITNAIEVLTNHEEKISKNFGVIIYDEDVISLPVQ